MRGVATALLSDGELDVVRTALQLALLLVVLALRVEMRREIKARNLREKFRRLGR